MHLPRVIDIHIKSLFSLEGPNLICSKMGLFEFRFLARCSWYGITPVLWFHHTFVLWGPLSYLHFRSINPLLEFITLKIQKIIPKIFANLFSLYEFHGHFISFLKTTFTIGLVEAIALSPWFFIDFLCCWKDFQTRNTFQKQLLASSNMLEQPSS